MTDRRLPRRRGPDETTTHHVPETADPVHPPTGPLPDQRSPVADSVVETSAPWRRRQREQRRQTDWVDPADEVETALAPDELAPGAPSPLQALRAHLLPRPDEQVDRHLGGGEKVLHMDHPALAWFLARKLPYFAGLVLLAVVFVVAVRSGWAPVAAATPAVALLVVLVLVAQRFADTYIAYVVTNARMIRMSGVLSTSVESIPWVRVTDVHFSRSAVERLLGCATLHIESANETMGLRRMTGIDQPFAFNRHLVDMVVAKQGPSEALGRRSDYNIMPPDRSLLSFRRRQKDQEAQAARSALEVDPSAGTTPSPADGGAGDAADGVAEGDAADETADAPLTPDPELPEDLSDMAGVLASELAANQRRQDQLLRRDADEDPPVTGR